MRINLIFNNYKIHYQSIITFVIRDVQE